MSGWQLVLEVSLIGLLGATLYHALRLERALGVIRRDRSELDALLRGFNDSARVAENATERLRGAAESGARVMTSQLEAATNLKDDLETLIARGERVNERLGGLVRANRAVESANHFAQPAADFPEAGNVRVRSQAERDLLRALRVTR